MKTRTFIVCLAAVFGVTFPACSQLVRICFTSEVTQVSGPLLPGVSVGSTITGQVEVDLAHFPSGESLRPDAVLYSYSGQERPGYVFEFNTGVQTYTLDSLNAGADLGLVPGIGMGDNPEGDGLSFAARDEGMLFGTVLGFDDLTAPTTLLSGFYFPEDVNLAEGLEKAEFRYADFFLTTDAVVAKVTSASMEIEQATPSALLIYRVNASSLSKQRKRPLIATLDAADAAFASGQCANGLRYLEAFKNKVRAQVAGTDSVLADHLMAGAQVIIDLGCGD